MGAVLEGTPVAVRGVIRVHVLSSSRNSTELHDCSFYI